MTKRILLGVGVAFLGMIAGLILGANFGGRYATGFEFNGLRGYEAMGQIGAIIGLVGGCVPGTILASLLGKRRR